jgi:hypothetical protein
MLSLPLLVTTVAGMASRSTLVGSEWRVKLNVGLEPGSYMATTGWGASGQRLIVNTMVKFEESMADDAEELVGPLAGTRNLASCGGAATFVSLEGEQEVRFASGGWSVQRTLGASPASEGLLRFWLDCTSGATKGDLSIADGERLFFSTSVYDDAAELQRLQEQRTAMESKLAEAEAAAEARRRGEEPGDEAGGVLRRIPGLSQIAAVRARVTAEDELLSLRYQKQFFESLPSLGVGPAAITTAPGQGSLSVKRPARGLGFMAKNEYHVLGRFEMEPV